MSNNLIAARDADGELVWFRKECAKSWSPTFFEDGPLYYRSGRWILMAGLFEIRDQPEGKFVEADTALAWLIRNNYELPAEILEEAQKRQI